MTGSSGIWRAEMALAERLRVEVEHSVQRALRGVERQGAVPLVVGRSRRITLERRGTLELVHYHAVTDEVFRIPLLIVMAPTHRGYLVDLAPGQSLVEFLLLRGFDVYMIDWNAPTPAEGGLALRDYVLDFIPECIRRVQQDSGEGDVNLLGYCAGGMLSVLYQALHADGPVRSLVCLAAPVDFSELEIFRAMSGEDVLDVDAYVERNPIIPASVVAAGFELPRPSTDAPRQARLWGNLWSDPFVRGLRMMERWDNEILPLPGAYFREMVKKLLRQNALYKGTLRLDGRLVELRNIEIPLLHFVARHDRIVPIGASAPLVQQVGSRDKEQVILPGGHVSVAAGANAVERMWPKLDRWLEVRSL